MEINTIEVTVTGTRPLLQNKFQDNEDGLPSKRGKKYDDKIEAEKRLEKNEKNVICQPASHFESSMIRSATEFKFQGRKTYKDLFKAGVYIEPSLIPHKSQRYQIDKRAVTINRSRILRCRPRFDKWELSFKIIVQDDRIDPLLVKQVLETAGRFHGVGDYRPKYGLFKVTKFNILKK
jgi:hypothetical protein